MTTYDALIKHLFSLSRGLLGKSDLMAPKALAAHLGNPQDCYPTIHIAGTNGKGSVACKVAEALILAGYRVGLYTSPHLITYRERIMVNREMISQEEVVEGLEKLFKWTKELQMQPSFFELTTHLAFRYFAEKKVDIAVIETGVGGRLDATNIIKPLLSVITTIGFDHEEALGRTLNAIAAEKGGVIKEKTPVVLGPNANLPILKSIAQLHKAPIHLVKQKEDENQDIALKVLKLLSTRFIISAKAMLEGIQKQPRCRFEILEDRIVLDVAHNRSAFERLFQRIKKRFPNRPIYLLFSFSKDKDLDSLTGLFKENVEQIGLLSFAHVRLRDPHEIGHKLKEGGYPSWSIFDAAETALTTLLDRSEKHNGIVLVAGSFYMMEEVALRGYTSACKLSTSLNIR